MKKGCLRGLPLASTAVGETCHSYQPSAGTMHRRERAALANAPLPPLPRTDSARAFVMRSPILTSSVDSVDSSPRGRRVSTTGACLDGAMFQSGSPTGGLWGFLSTLRAGSPVWFSSTSKASMSSSGRALAAYLPHMRHSVCRGTHERSGRGRAPGTYGYVDTVGVH